MGLGVIEIATNRFTWVKQHEWDIENLTINHDKQVLAYTVNEGGISKGVLLHLLENDQPRIQHWEAPKGAISELNFSPDNKRIVYVLNGATNPADIWELNVASLHSKRVTYVSHSPVVEPLLVEPELIHYPSFDGLNIPAFYYKPRVSAPRNLPVVIFVHGGPESQIRPTYHPSLQYLLNRGYAVCTPNVRGSTGYGKTYTHLDDVRKRMDSVKDLAYLVEWLKTEGKADPERIAIMGRSYGGFMVLAAITHYPDLWAAAIEFVGISSIKTFLQNTSVWRRKLRESEYGCLETDGDFFDEIDPLHRTNAIRCPLMVLHGANDPRVSISESEQIVVELRERNHPVSYIRFEDEGHSFVKQNNIVKAYTDVAEFLDLYMSES